jgi:hypothetical protein
MKTNFTQLLFVVLLLAGQRVFSQSADSTKATSHFSGVITATNNGISLLPNFMLGKPALLFDLSLGKGRLSFDPMLRFAMEGKPWSFIFWWRYKLADGAKFKMSVGAHPSVVFRTVSVSTEGVAKEYFTAQRYAAGEVTPTYFFSPNASIGVQYLGSRGLSQDAIRRTHFVALRGTLANVKLSENLALTVMPQAYYLNMDGRQGTYVNATVFLTKKNVPVSFSAIANRALHTEIAGRAFVWNVALNYHLNNTYRRIR